MKNTSSSQILYWSTILFLTLMNFFVAMVLVPFFLAAPSFALYMSVAIFGLLFGQLFNLLMTKIEDLERHHHIFASTFIPLIGLASMLAALSSVESIASSLHITLTQNPKVTVLIYVAAFLLPNAVTRIIQRK